MTTNSSRAYLVYDRVAMCHKFLNNNFPRQNLRTSSSLRSVVAKMDIIKPQKYVEVENDLIFLSKKRPVLSEAIEEIVAFAEASSAVR